MPKLRIEARTESIDLRARKIRRSRLLQDARRAVEWLRTSAAGRDQGVVLLVFDLVERDVTGYVNVDPVLAALALIDYMEQTYPRSARRTQAENQKQKPKKRRIPKRT